MSIVVRGPKHVLPAVSAVILLVAACSASPSGSEPSAVVKPPSTALNTYNTLTIDDFADILNNRSDDYIVVNVHIPYEGEVEQTDVNIPYNDMETLTAALPDNNAQIILYCRSGRMSKEASEKLAALGYTQIWDVPGGMIAWEDSGRTIIRNKP